MTESQTDRDRDRQTDRDKTERGSVVKAGWSVTGAGGVFDQCLGGSIRFLPLSTVPLCGASDSN